jgi:hypothetical protein
MFPKLKTLIIDRKLSSIGFMDNCFLDLKYLKINFKCEDIIILNNNFPKLKIL